jgi:hypothetical protein
MTIIDISYCNDKYIETEQDTIRFIIQNTKPNKVSEFSIKLNNYMLFGTIEDINVLKELLKNSKNLADLGFVVNVGTVVWNQCKDILTNDNTKTRLVYSSDIKDGNLLMKQYSNEEKKNYINKKGQTNPILVINRGWGVGDYNFEYCLIEGDCEYLIENHLICINYTKEISKKDLITLTIQSRQLAQKAKSIGRTLMTRIIEQLYLKGNKCYIPSLYNNILILFMFTSYSFVCK